MPDEMIQSLRDTARFKSVPTARPPLVTIIQGNGGKLDALDRKEVLDLMHKHGVVLFRGFSIGADGFLRFSERFCSQFMQHVAPKLRPSQSEDGTVAQVLTGKGAITLHGEMNFLPMRPDVLWFHCIKPSVEGGETLVADSRDVLSSLSETTRTIFQERQVRYRHNLPPDIWRLSFKDSPRELAVTVMGMLPGTTAIAFGDENIQMDFVADPIRPTGRSGEPGFLNSITNVVELIGKSPTVVTFADGEPIPEELLQDILRAGAARAEPIQWQPDDLVMIDNSRVMHGRAAFSGEESERKINVRFGMLAEDLK